MVIIFSSHPVYDDRIIRHVKYLLSLGLAVYCIHYNLSGKPEPEGPFSLFGEKAYMINIPFRFNALKKLYLLSPFIVRRTKKAMKALGIKKTDPAIIHNHNPELFKAVIAAKRELGKSFVVYDRHEYYESMKGIGRIKTLHLMEKVYAWHVDCVVVVSEGMLPFTRGLFPGRDVALVPNFPMAAHYDRIAVMKKIDEFDDHTLIDLIYIGSINMSLDRDVELMFGLVDKILASFERCRFTIGGEARDQKILGWIKDLQEKYNGRFRYLGMVPREKAVAMTQKAHLGFFLIKPDAYGEETFSPNKIFEYLICGAIPVVRARIDHAVDVGRGALLFGARDDIESISAEIASLLSDRSMIKQRMRECVCVADRFSWELVADNYRDLYSCFNTQLE